MNKHSPQPQSPELVTDAYLHNFCKQAVLFLAVQKETNVYVATTKPESSRENSWRAAPAQLCGHGTGNHTACTKRSAAWKSRRCCYRQILPVAGVKPSLPQHLIKQQGYGFRIWFTCFVWLLDCVWYGLQSLYCTPAGPKAATRAEKWARCLHSSPHSLGQPMALKGTFQNQVYGPGYWRQPLIGTKPDSL